MPELLMLEAGTQRLQARLPPHADTISGHAKSRRAHCPAVRLILRSLSAKIADCQSEEEDGENQGGCSNRPLSPSRRHVRMRYIHILLYEFSHAR